MALFESTWRFPLWRSMCRANATATSVDTMTMSHKRSLWNWVFVSTFNLLIRLLFFLHSYVILYGVHRLLHFIAHKWGISQAVVTAEGKLGAESTGQDAIATKWSWRKVSFTDSKTKQNKTKCRLVDCLALWIHQSDLRNTTSQCLSCSKYSFPLL